jgi:AmmeMemoRadiSam system protein B
MDRGAPRKAQRRGGRPVAAGLLVLATAAAVAGWAIRAGGCALWAGDGPEASAWAQEAAGAPAHADRFADAGSLRLAMDGAGRVLESLRRAEGDAGNSTEGAAPGAGEGEFVAAVIPHHLVAGRLAAGLFAFLRARPPDVVVVVGPDHFRRGPAVGTGFGSWRTAWGEVGAADELVGDLLAAGLASDAWQALDGEHSVGAVMPFIKRYLPQAEVVALTLRRETGREEAADLGRFVRDWAVEKGRRVFVVASVDFSHYLPLAQAEVMDSVTLAALERADWDALYGMGPSNLDSPGALTVAFAFAGSLEKTRFRVIDHTNSAVLLGQPNLSQTTSHFLLTILGPDG